MKADRATPQHADPFCHPPLPQCSIAYFLRLRAEVDGNRPYLTFGDRTYTFGETEKRCRDLARGLAKRGIKAGSRVLLLLPNCVEFVFTWFACSLLGATIVPLNTSLKGFLLEAQVEDAQAEAAIVKDELLPALDAMRAEFKQLLPWLAVAGDTSGAQSIVAPERIVPFDTLYLAKGVDPEVPGDFRRIQIISYTSGTTGPSKGVMLPDGLTFNSARTFMRLSGMTREDVVYTPLPLFHGLSSRMCALPALMLGAHAVIDERFSASRYWERAAQCQATLGQVVHALVPLIKAQPPGAFDRTHRVRALFNAPHDLEFEKRFGVCTLEAFAMTETSHLLYFPYPERVVGSTGRAHEHWDIELVDDNDVPVPVGEAGELVARPRMPYIIMQGYHNKPQATLDAWRNLWFHTGDILRRDAEGNYFYIDRKKERIRRRGENVSSSEVEHGVAAHPAIAECVAIAHPAPTGEDDIRLVAVLKDGAAVTPAALFEWLRERLPKFMLPRYIELVHTLPRTGTGKVEKLRLVQQGLGAGVWDAQSPGST
jgi:crotonobetaine/carnitine-CoA ligase